LFCDVLSSFGDSWVKSSQIVHCYCTAGALSLLLVCQRKKITSQTVGEHDVQVEQAH
jgi:hypothetical protein